MKLLDNALLERFAEIGCQEDSNDPIVVAKYFNPFGGGVWYATEYIPAQRIFFGYAMIFADCGEWGYFSLDEMESLKTYGGILRDLNWQEVRASKAIPRFVGFRK